MSLTIHVAPGKPGVAHVSLAGTLDTDTSPQLEKALAGVDAGVLLLALDMKELEYISSAGLRVLFAAQKRQEAKGGKVVARNLSPGVRKVFEIVKALPGMQVFASDQEMDDYLAHFQKKSP